MKAEIQAFLLAHSKWSPATRQAYQRGLQQLAFFLENQGFNWKQCGPQDLDNYRTNLLWQAKFGGGLYSPNSIDQALRAARLFYRWLLSLGLLALDPTAHWILPRPPQPPQPILSREILLKLLNLPALSRPQGTRDQLLLELLMAGLSLPQCRELSLDLRDLPLLEQSAAAALARYLETGRPRLFRAPTAALLLTTRGEPFRSDAGLRAILRGYQTDLGLDHPLSPRLLRYSQLDQIKQLRRRRDTFRLNPL